MGEVEASGPRGLGNDSEERRIVVKTKRSHRSYLEVKVRASVERLEGNLRTPAEQRVESRRDSVTVILERAHFHKFFIGKVKVFLPIFIYRSLNRHF